MSKKIAVLASGSGTNAENLIKYFQQKESAEVSVVLTNNPSAGVIARAGALNVPLKVFTKKDLTSGAVAQDLKELDIDLIVLAGFLWLIPENLIDAFEGRIINIHPSLLPKYGGKGMYGSRVHEAVISNGEAESGITIHQVDKEYDKGKVLFQVATQVSDSDTPETLAYKIHLLEYEHFPKIVESVIETL